MSTLTGPNVNLPVIGLPLIERNGRLMGELELTPARFGLGLTPPNMKPQGLGQSVCGFCSTGCNLNVLLDQGVAVGVTPAENYPVNQGTACPKGWEALEVTKATDRATQPLVRKLGKLAPVSWPEALETFVTRMKAIQAKHGPASTAFISTGQIATEEMALLGSLAKFGMGMIHGDGNTRQCMASAVVAYKQSFGFDAPPYTYADLEESDVIVLVGSNLCIAHPILWRRVLNNLHSPEIVVIDPRATETSMAATLHLPLAPKSDLTLFYGIARELIHRGAINPEYIAAHTTGFEEFAEFVEPFTLEVTAAETRLSPVAIRRFADAIERGKRVSFWWTMGVNQSHQAVRTAQALINLALITGNMGRPGTGANSITGQCNAMGSRLYSNTTNLLGGRDFSNAADRQRVADVLEIDEANIPREGSWAYHRIMEGILRGEIRGLWVVATNPLHSWINQEMARDVLDRLDFLVVQDMYHTTETAEAADLVLPAAGWGEKEGTFINSERRFGRVSKVKPAPGEALADFYIFRLLADAWGCGEMFQKWTTPATAFEILKELSAGQPCDITGIKDYAMLTDRGGVQWPQPAGAAPPEQERRLFADGRFFHPDGKAKLIFEASRPMAELPSDKFPLLLNTGRGSAAQWHTQTRTAKSQVLKKLSAAAPYVELNPHDATRLAIRPGDLVRVSSQRGSQDARALVTPAVQPGQVFMPMHDRDTNLLTHADFDPYSYQPAYKGCAVNVVRVR